MLNRTKKLIPVAMAMALAALPSAVSAQDLVPTQLRPIDDPVVVIRGIIRFILLLAFIIAFVMLLIGGIRWIMAGGDEKSVEKARNTITAALIGLVIVLVAYALIRIIEIFFNVQILTETTTIPVFNAE